jgi:hypothetical protein
MHVDGMPPSRGKVERAKRFEGGVQELGPARVQLMARLSKARHGAWPRATLGHS